MKKAEERLIFKKLYKIARLEEFRNDTSYEYIIENIINGEITLKNFIYGKDISSLINSAKNIKAFREMFIKVNNELKRDDENGKNKKE